MLVESLAGQFQKLRTTNFSNSAFSTLKSTTVRPSGDGVIDLVGGAPHKGGTVPPYLDVVFFGTGNDDTTFDVRVYGWAQESTTGSWEQILLAKLTCTLTALTGTANCAIGSADKIVDTIAMTYGNDDVDLSIVSPANNERGAHIQIDTKGCAIVQFDFDMTGATDANLLYRKVY